MEEIIEIPLRAVLESVTEIFLFCLISEVLYPYHCHVIHIHMQKDAKL